MNERWQKIERLYHAARELDGDEQARFLDEACRSDAEMRRQIDNLLKRNREDSFLNTPAVEEFAVRRTAGSPISPKTQIGPYEVIGVIGAGGMGEVYKARDTRLNRNVAIKFVHEQFSARFEREARAISSLNHPHVCTLYDVGPNYLVMEFVEGETLAARLEKGKLPLGLALRYGAEIADALAAAHAKGIIHRDLKPGNVMIAKSGVKVVDFGLAKASEDETLTSSLAAMGTPAYMAPEQREGKNCDARTDIYALGLLLHEATTGKRVLADQPANLAELPEKLSHIVARCLETDPQERWQSAIDLKNELMWASAAEQVSNATRTLLPPGWTAAIAAAFLIVVAVLAWTLYHRQPPAAEARPLLLTINAPPESEFREGSAISPDGRNIAFVAHVSGVDRLFIRPLDSLKVHELMGTDGATFPFWSPDGRFVAFFAEGKLKRIDIASGILTVICSVGSGRGGTWNENGVILFNSVNDGPLLQVAAAGGTPVPVTTVDTAREENSHRFPHFLPGGRQFLYFVRSRNTDVEGIYLGSFDRPKEKIRLRKSPTAAVVASTRNGQPAYLAWVENGTLMLQPFDLEHRRLIQEAVAFADGIRFNAAGKNAEISVSDQGTMVYGTDTGLSRQLTWLNRDGSPAGNVGVPDSYAGLKISADGTRLAISRPVIGIAVMELSRGVTTPVWRTGFWGAWSPDRLRIAYSFNLSGPPNIYIAAATGAGEAERLTESNNGQIVADWSADGRFILYTENSNDPSATNQSGLYVLPLQGERKPIQLVESKSRVSAQFSPDTHWIAYSAIESGRREIYVQSFPAGRAKWQISIKGGDYPRWSNDGKELFYIGPDQTLTAVSARPASSSLEFGASHALFKISSTQEQNAADYPYDIAPGAHRILALNPASNAETPSLTVVSNWQAALRR